jgi:phosphoribosylanthranilate isomerase
MREAGNIRAVEQLDIDWMGFIFHPPSPRHVFDSTDVETVRRCRRTKVGVFVDADLDAMMATAGRYAFDCVQLHGSESPAICHALRTRGCTVIKAFSVASAADLKRTDDYEGAASLFLFDTKSNVCGGSGQRFDWSLLHNYHGHTPFLLSGGIAPGCVDELLRFRHPMMTGADLNSGFEIAPAVKDTVALAAFVKVLKNAE